MLNLTLDIKDPAESVSDYCYRVLKKNIIYLHIKPGESISENIAAAALNVSRTPIRETFSKLIKDDLLEVYPQRGTYVPRIDMNRIRESVFMRMILEDGIMKLACENFPEEYLFLLESNFNQQLFCCEKNKFEEIFELDNQMHELIYRGCGMPRIWQTIVTISSDQMRMRYLKLFSKLRWAETIEEHKQIVEAIKNKDVETGRKYMHEHVTKLGGDSEFLRQEYSDYFIAD